MQMLAESDSMLRLEAEIQSALATESARYREAESMVSRLRQSEAVAAQLVSQLRMEVSQERERFGTAELAASSLRRQLATVEADAASFRREVSAQRAIQGRRPSPQPAPSAPRPRASRFPAVLGPRSDFSLHRYTSFARIVGCSPCRRSVWLGAGSCLSGSGIRLPSLSLFLQFCARCDPTARFCSPASGARCRGRCSRPATSNTARCLVLPCLENRRASIPCCC